MLLRTVTAGSVTTSWADVGLAARATSMSPRSVRRIGDLPPCLHRLLLRLSPRSERITGPGHERRVHCAGVAPVDELHIDCPGFCVTLPLAPSQQLFQGVRQELIRCHVLAAREELA